MSNGAGQIAGGAAGGAALGGLLGALILGPPGALIGAKIGGSIGFGVGAAAASGEAEVQRAPVSQPKASLASSMGSQIFVGVASSLIVLLITFGVQKGWDFLTKPRQAEATMQSTVQPVAKPPKRTPPRKAAPEAPANPSANAQVAPLEIPPASSPKEATGAPAVDTTKSDPAPLDQAVTQQETVIPPPPLVPGSLRPGPNISARMGRVYPARALRQGITGRVVLACTVSERARVSCAVQSESPEGYGFAEAALKLVDGFAATPATQGGVPVPSERTLTIPFEIE